MTDFEYVSALVAGAVALIAAVYLFLLIVYPDKPPHDDNTPYGDTTGWPKH